MLEDKIPVLILAGGKKNLPWKEMPRHIANCIIYRERFLTYKPLIKINDKPMVQYPIDAFNSYKRTSGEIYVVGPEEIDRKVTGYKRRINHGNSLGETACLGLDAVISDHKDEEIEVLISTCDIVRLTPGAINHFEESCKGIEDYTMILPFIDKKYIKKGGIFGWRPGLGCKEGRFRIANISKLHITRDFAEIIRKGAAHLRNEGPADETMSRIIKEADDIYLTRRWLNPMNWYYLIKYFKEDGNLLFNKWWHNKLSITDLEKAGNQNISKFASNIDAKVRIAQVKMPELAEDIDALADWRALRKPKLWDYLRTVGESALMGASGYAAISNYDNLKLFLPSLAIFLLLGEQAKKDAAMLYRAGKLSNPSD